MRLSVVIPTFQRPDQLLEAVRSVFAQTGMDGVPFEIVVVDNCPNHSAADAMARLKAESPVPFEGLSEPRPGVANARNAALGVAKAPIIAFIDDDEIAAPDWLSELLAAHERLQAPIVFGRVVARLPDPDHPHAAFLNAFFSRDAGQEERLLDDFYGCGNCLIDRASLGLPTAPFDPRANEIGGEDDYLFAPLMRAGTPFGWAPNASVWEVVPASRATLGYILRRSFAYGQSPSQACAAAKPTDILGVAFWMAVGAAQFFGFGAAAAGAWVVRAPQRLSFLDRAVKGLGKVFWMPMFEFRFYGQAATRQPR